MFQIDRPMTIKTEVTELGQPMKNLAFFTVANLLKEKQKLEITEIDQAVTFSRELDTVFIVLIFKNQINLQNYKYRE